MKKPVRHARKYLAFAAAAASFAFFDYLFTAAIHRGYDLPQPHPFKDGVWIADKEILSEREWWDISHKHRVVVALTWIFLTSGASHTLEADFNTASNQINAIGSGLGGHNGTASVACGCGTIPGQGGNGGPAGAFAQITNYSGHSAGQLVNIQVGAAIDTIFDSSAVLLAKAGSGTTGGQAASSVGTVKANGGNAGLGGVVDGTLAAGSGGGGGGGAGGPGSGSGAAGSNGANGTNSIAGGAAGSGGTGDGGNTAVGAAGQEFGPDAGSNKTGSGGGANGGHGGTTGVGLGGGIAGLYGAGGGGGGGGGGTGAGGQAGGGGGAGTQGLLAYSYTPSAGGARAFSFFIS